MNIGDEVLVTDTYFINFTQGMFWSKTHNKWLNKLTKKGYKTEVYINGKYVNQHRSIYELYHNIKIPENMQIDHVNGVRNDNGISNLRILNNQENSQNRKNANGYSYRKDTKKWRAYINFNGKKEWIGNFLTENEAKEARNIRAKEINENQNGYYKVNY